MSSIARLSNPALEEMGFDPVGLRQPISVNIEEQLVNTRQYFPDNGIEGQRIENLNVAKLKAGTLSVDTYIQSTGYVQGSTGWRIDGQGNAEFNNLTLTGGSINFGKTSFSDSTNAGYYISSSGVYFGSASNARYLKYTIATGAFALSGGTIDVGVNGSISGGQTDYNTGTGFFLGYSGGAYKLSIGDSTTSNSLTWDGSVLSVNGSTIAGNDVFGSGVDGAFALDGTNTYATYFSKSGSTYTQLMDVFATTVTLSSSAILITNGYRLFCKTSLTVGSGCVIKWNGNNGGNGSNGTFSNTSTGGAGGAGGSAGTALTSAGLYGSLAGLAGSSGGSGGNGVSSGGGYGGGNGGSGSNGAAIANCFALTFVGNGGAGGRGGVRRPDGGSEGTGLGGSAGSASTLTASKVRPYSATFAIDMFDRDDSQNLKYLKYNGQAGGSGAGGGGAGGGGSGARCGGAGGGSGGNGSGGGTIVICARVISNAGSIQSVGGNGGNGGNGADAANPAGGSAVQAPGGGGGGGAGAGGPGGTIILIYTSLSGAGTISSVAGSNGSAGTGGAGKADDSGHTGDNGAAGSAATSSSTGVTIQLQV